MKLIKRIENNVNKDKINVNNKEFINKNLRKLWKIWPDSLKMSRENYKEKNKNFREKKIKFNTCSNKPKMISKGSINISSRLIRI